MEFATCDVASQNFISLSSPAPLVSFPLFSGIKSYKQIPFHNQYLVYMDYIHVSGIRAYGYTGYLAEEQVLGQWFEVDVKLWLDISKAAKTEDIGQTVDYRSTINLVKDLIKNSKFLLIERLVETIADSILKQNDRVSQVQVILSKPAAPIPDFGGKISIDITRNRSSSPTSSNK